MRVYLKASGIMAQYLGTEPLPVELPEQAGLGDLMAYIGRHLAPQMPPYLWNSQSGAFRGPVVISIDQKIIKDPAAGLAEGQTIQIIKAFVGG